MATDVQDLTQEDYELIRKLVYAKSGINLGPHKQQLVRARLGKRIRAGHCRSFREYYRQVEQDPSGDKLCETDSEGVRNRRIDLVGHRPSDVVRLDDVIEDRHDGRSR